MVYMTYIRTQYFGDSIMDANASRCFVFHIAAEMDQRTNKMDWAPHAELTYMPRSSLLHWLWQLKFISSRTVTSIGDTMVT